LKADHNYLSANKILSGMQGGKSQVLIALPKTKSPFWQCMSKTIGNKGDLP